MPLPIVIPIIIASAITMIIAMAAITATITITLISTTTTATTIMPSGFRSAFSFAFTVGRSMGRARGQRPPAPRFRAGRFPLRVTARLSAQPAGVASENANHKENFMTDITSIPLGKLVVSEDNVRRTAATDAGLQELANSIATHGLLQSRV